METNFGSVVLLLVLSEEFTVEEVEREFSVF